MSRTGKNNSKQDSPRLLEKILQVLQDSNKPLNYKQVAGRLGINDQSQKMLVNFTLRDLAKKKTITEAGRGSYKMAENRSRSKDSKGFGQLPREKEGRPEKKIYAA